MILFIRNIPASTQYSELQNFVTPALKRRFWFGTGKVLKVEILAIRDKMTNAMEYHGLVHIAPDKVGLRAIRSLKGQRFKNRPVLIREYQSRSWHNDRRQGIPASKINLEKRVSDRRRGDSIELIKDVSNLFSGKDEFTHKYGARDR